MFVMEIKYVQNIMLNRYPDSVVSNKKILNLFYKIKDIIEDRSLQITNPNQLNRGFTKLKKPNNHKHDLMNVEF